MPDDNLSSVLNDRSEKKIRDNVSTLMDIVDNLGRIILKLPDYIEPSINQLSQELNAAKNYLSGLEARTAQLEQYMSTQGYDGQTAAPPVAPVSVPVPPAAPRLAPPPGSEAKPAPQKPTDLRGAIMTELKAVFANRRAKSE